MPKKKKINNNKLKRLQAFFKDTFSKKQPARRVKKGQKYKSFSLQKKIKVGPVEDFGIIFRRAIKLLSSAKLTLILHSLIFALLYLLFVRGIGSAIDIREQVETAGGASIANSVNVFGSVFTNAGAARSGTASVLQVILFIVFSLSLLWLLRTIRSKEKNINVLDAYYFGPSQAVPYMLVLLFALVQLIPVTLGNAIITTAQRNNLIISNVEQLAFVSLAALLAAASLFLLSGALFAMIVASLPNARPLESIRAGNELVRHRRWPVAARLLLFFALIIAATFVVTIPFIFLVPAVAEYVFYICSVATLVFGHAFLYELYRGLLKK